MANQAMSVFSICRRAIFAHMYTQISSFMQFGSNHVGWVEFLMRVAQQLDELAQIATYHYYMCKYCTMRQSNGLFKICDASFAFFRSHDAHIYTYTNTFAANCSLLLLLQIHTDDDPSEFAKTL